MRAYIPYTITDSMIVSSSVTEPASNEPVYSATTTYAEGAQVSVITANSHLVYESLVAGNLNNPVTDITKWILKGNTNRWRMFDYNQGNPTVAPSPFTLVLRPGKRVDSLTLELKATTLEVNVNKGIGGPLVYTLDGFLQERQATTFYEWLFSPFSYRRMVSTSNIPQTPDPVITITLTDPSGFVEISRLAIGQSTFLGNIQWEPIIDADNYSKIEWDQFGHATLTPIPSIPISEQKIVVENNRLDIVRRFRDEVNGRAAVWSGLDDINGVFSESLIIFGVYRSYQLDLSNPAFSVLNLSLKGI